MYFRLYHLSSSIDLTNKTEDSRFPRLKISKALRAFLTHSYILQFLPKGSETPLLKKSVIQQMVLNNGLGVLYLMLFLQLRHYNVTRRVMTPSNEMVATS